MVVASTAGVWLRGSSVVEIFLLFLALWLFFRLRGALRGFKWSEYRDL
jgi:hypothetical protein